MRHTKRYCAGGSVAMFLQHYPYFVEGLVLLLLALGMVLLLPQPLRLVALFGGIFSAPFAALSLLHVPAFWKPEYVWSTFPNPEDLLWCAAMGLTTWVMALFPLRHRIEWEWCWPRSFLRYVMMGTMGLMLHWPVLLVLSRPAGTMPATLFALLFVGACICICWHPPARKFIGWPVAVFALYHWIDVQTFFRLWPRTREYWNPAAQLPFTFFGVPAYEVFWAASFGLTWPAVMAYSFKVRFSARSVKK